MKDLELTDEIYDELIDRYGKVVVIQVEEDRYALRYPNRVEFNAIKQAQLRNQNNLERASQAVEQVVQDLVVFPEKEDMKEILESDGGLMFLISGQFMNFYTSRAMMDEKKRPLTS